MSPDPLSLPPQLPALALSPPSLLGPPHLPHRWPPAANAGGAAFRTLYHSLSRVTTSSASVAESAYHPPLSYSSSGSLLSSPAPASPPRPQATGTPWRRHAHSLGGAIADRQTDEGPLEDTSLPAFVIDRRLLANSLRPLQGLWKGMCEDMNLKFYLVSYDDIGGITCRMIGDSSEELFCYSPIFWILDTMFIEAPFSEEEEEIYNTRVHTYPHIAAQVVVNRILYINSSYDLMLPELTSSYQSLTCPGKDLALRRWDFWHWKPFATILSLT